MVAPVLLLLDVVEVAFPPAWFYWPAAWSVVEGVECGCYFAEECAFGGDAAAPVVLEPAVVAELGPFFGWDVEVLVCYEDGLVVACVVVVVDVLVGVGFLDYFVVFVVVGA